MNNLKGKTAVITGCGAGIGKQIAIRFAEDGANLAICDINFEALSQTAEICKEKVRMSCMLRRILKIMMI